MINYGYIGEGSFSNVYKVLRNDENKFYALKVCQITIHCNYKTLMNEINTVNKLQNNNDLSSNSFNSLKKNICYLYCHFILNNEIHQLYEYCEYGSLSFINEYYKIFSSYEILFILLQISASSA